MSDDPQISNEVLWEKMNGIEQQIKWMHQNVGQRIDSLTEQVKKTNGTVGEHGDDIDDLKAFKNNHDGGVNVWKWIATFAVGLSAVLISLMAYLSK